MFHGLTLGSNNYKGVIQDITISLRRANQVGEPLTLAEQVALRSELGKFSRAARITMPYSLGDASVSAQTFG